MRPDTPIKVIVIGKLIDPKTDKFRRTGFMREIMKGNFPIEQGRIAIGYEFHALPGNPTIQIIDIGAPTEIDSLGTQSIIRGATIIIGLAANPEENQKYITHAAKMGALYVDASELDFSKMNAAEIREQFIQWQAKHTQPIREKIEKEQEKIKKEVASIQKPLIEAVNVLLKDDPEAKEEKILKTLHKKLKAMGYEVKIHHLPKNPQISFYVVPDKIAKKAYEKTVEQTNAAKRNAIDQVLFGVRQNEQTLPILKSFVEQTCQQIIHKAISASLDKNELIDIENIREAILKRFARTKVLPQYRQDLDDKICVIAGKILHNQYREKMKTMGLDTANFTDKTADQIKQQFQTWHQESARQKQQFIQETLNTAIGQLFKEKPEVTQDQILKTIHKTLEKMGYKVVETQGMIVIPDKNASHVYDATLRQIKDIKEKAVSKILFATDLVLPNDTLSLHLISHVERVFYEIIRKALFAAMAKNEWINIDNTRNEVLKRFDKTTISERDFKELNTEITLIANAIIQTNIKFKKHDLENDNLLSKKVIQGKMAALNALSFLSHVINNSALIGDLTEDQKQEKITTELSVLVENAQYIDYHLSPLSRGKTETAQLMETVFSADKRLREQYEAIRKEKIQAAITATAKNVLQQIAADFENKTLKIAKEVNVEDTPQVVNVPQSSGILSRIRSTMQRLFGKKQEQPVMGVVVSESKADAEPSSGLIARIRHAIRNTGSSVMGFLFGKKEQPVMGVVIDEKVSDKEQQQTQVQSTGLVSRARAAMQRLFGRRNEEKILPGQQLNATPSTKDDSIDAEVRKIANKYIKADASRVELLRRLIAQRNDYLKNKNTATVTLLNLAITSLTTDRAKFSAFFNQWQENKHDDKINDLLEQARQAYNDIGATIKKEKQAAIREYNAKNAVTLATASQPVRETARAKPVVAQSANPYTLFAVPNHRIESPAEITSLTSEDSVHSLVPA